MTLSPKTIKHILTPFCIGLTSGVGVGVLVCDLLSSFPFFRATGTYIWFAGYFLFLGFAAYCLHRLISLRRWATIVTLAVIAGIFLSLLDDPRSLSGETTVQAKCGLTLIAQPDLGRKANCMYGYPSRQYLLTVLPTLLFGRSQPSLNLGATLYILMGAIIMAAGLATFYPKRSHADLVAALVLAALLHLDNFLRVGYYFEQSVYPISLLMLVMGIYLIFLRHPSLFTLNFLALAVLYCVYAYTPAMAIFGLGYVVLLWHLFRPPLAALRPIILVWILILSLETYLSYTARHDLQLFHHNPTFSLVTNVQNTFQHLFLQNQGERFASPIIHPILILTLTFTLFGLANKPGIILSLWAWAVILTGVLFQGYSYGSVDYRFHRALPAFPLLMALFADRLSRHWGKYVMAGIWGLILTTGIWNALTYARLQPFRWHEVLHRDVQTVMARQPRLQTQPFTLLVDTHVPGELISAYDSFSYYYPAMKQQLAKQTCEVFVLTTQDPTLVVTHGRLEFCPQWSPGRYRFLGTTTKGIGHYHLYSSAAAP